LESVIINKKNWDTHLYKTNFLYAFISIGADVDGSIIYFLNITDHDFTTEYFQKTFSDLDYAIKELNSKYGQWVFSLRLEKPEGCGH
jgi:hypothetical protein